MDDGSDVMTNSKIQFPIPNSPSGDAPSSLTLRRSPVAHGGLGAPTTEREWGLGAWGPLWGWGRNPQDRAGSPIPNSQFTIPNPQVGDFMIQKILIVDDEPNIVILMEQALEALEDQGVELLTARNGEEALATIKTEKPNLVFLDVMMPKMSGLEVCYTVKHDLQMTDIYIVMLTAKGQEFDKQKGVDFGADLYLTKPFRPKEVLEKSMQVLGLSGIS
ncbi:response regulator receiver protein [Nostoc sp. NIES-4103]|nr:response regulator receiver protein [Nostoc sp. NIES-4103]